MGVKLNGTAAPETVFQVDNIAFIGPAQPATDIDFKATSYGIQTACTPIGRVCQLGVNEFGAGTPYDCGSTYPGVSGAAVPFNLTPISPEGKQLTFATVYNPFNVVVNALLDSPDNANISDPEFITPVHGDRTILLWCDVEVLDVHYSMVNQSLSIISTEITDNATALPIVAALVIQLDTISYPLWVAAEVDAVSGDSQIFSRLFANDISRIGVGFGAGIMTNSSSTQESRRISFFVSKLPKAPLFTLTVSLLLYTVLALFFGALNIFRQSSFGMICYYKRDGKIINVNQLEVVQSRLVEPLSVVQEVFGMSKCLRGLTANEMFRDETDGVLAVRFLQRYETGKSIVLELLNPGNGGHQNTIDVDQLENLNSSENYRL